MKWVMALGGVWGAVGGAATLWEGNPGPERQQEQRTEACPLGWGFWVAVGRGRRGRPGSGGERKGRTWRAVWAPRRELDFLLPEAGTPQRLKHRSSVTVTVKVMRMTITVTFTGHVLGGVVSAQQ